jgi:pyruvate dehydrogenase E2 component (dihydrolipoamide acetyltransferase)
MTDVVMPRLSDTMEEGTILRWLKHDGERVVRGEELVEIETDKASMTYESDREGVLQRLAGEGDTLAVGEPIARIGEPSGNGAPPARSAAIERTAPVAGPKPEPTTTPQAPSPTRSEHGRVKASPLARRIARETGVELQSIAGTGPGGRIVKADVEGVAGSSPVAPVPAGAAGVSHDASESTPRGTGETAPPAVPAVGDIASAKGEATIVELSRTQRTIARRMAESKATIPDFTLTADVDMEACVALRAELKRLSHDEAPTYNDMIVKACALALCEHPRANGSYRDGRFELHSRVNVGVAVAVDPGTATPDAATSGTDTSGALVVPTVFDADAKALGEIARETRTLAARVRDGQVTPPELSGATFTVSNLGMYGIRQFTAIVNPPQAAILAVGAVQPRAVVVRKKKIAARQQMSVTLACDHRILYGADAALFLARVRELLEEPAALTL